MKPPLIPCGRCDGTGKVQLPPELFATLMLMVERRGLTAPQLAETMPHCASKSAANQRLETLRSLGLARRDRFDGKTWVYYATDRP